jgi:hypothetical protein
MSERLKEHDWKSCVREIVPRVQIPLSPPEIQWLKKPGPAQREGYESRQVRKEAAVVVVLCAAGRLAFIKAVTRNA